MHVRQTGKPRLQSGERGAEFEPRRKSVKMAAAIVMDRRSRHGAAAAAIVALGLATATAHAAPGLAVIVEGPQAARLRATVTAAVPAGWTVTPARAVTRAARGVRIKKLDARLGAIAEKLKAAVVYARTAPRGKVLLVVARPGEAPAQRRVARAAVAAAVAESLQPPASAPAPAAAAPATAAPASAAPAAAAPAAAAPATAATAATAPAPPAAATAPTVKPAAKPERHARAPAPAPTPAAPAAAEPPPTSGAEAGALVARAESPSGSLFEVALDGGIGARKLQYTQPLTGNLPSYSVAAVPWLGFRAALFPFARLRVPVLRDFGAYGDFGRSLYQQSVIAGSMARLNATWTSFDVGARERLRLARRFAPELDVALAYGRVAFDFDQRGQLVADTPSVDYRYVRPALDARVRFGPLTLFAGFGYRAVLSAGYVGSHFPHASVGGIDVGFGAAVSLPRNLVVSLSGQYQRYFYDLRPQPGDPYVAGGALDEFAVGELALAYVY